MVVYLPPALHRRLRAQAARLDLTVSALVEAAVTARLDEQRRVPLPAGLERGEPDPVVDALAAFGAPLWSSGQPARVELVAAILQGLAASRRQPSLLHVLPIVLHANRDSLSLEELRFRSDRALLPALGMLLELTAELTGDERLRGWADELWRQGVRQAPVEPFFTARTGARYLALAAERSPELVRRWGFVLATPLDDFRAALERHGGRALERHGGRALDRSAR